MSLRLYDDALTELGALKNLAPEEANVFFLLGKCYKGLGDRAGAVRAFTTALNLDTKVSLSLLFLPAGLEMVGSYSGLIVFVGGAVYQRCDGGVG